MLLVILHYRLRAAWNAVRTSTTRQRFISAALFVASLALALGVFVGFRIIMQVRGHGPAADALTHELVYAVFLFMLAGSTPFLAATLLHPGDLDLLGSAPVRPTHMVLIRILEGALAGAVQFAPIGAPAVVAIGAGLGYTGTQWLLLAPVALALVLLPAALTATLLLAAVAALGPSRVRSAIALVNVVLGSLVCLTAVSQVTGLRLQQGLAGLATASANPSGRVALFPLWGWIAEGVLAGGQHDMPAYALAMLGTFGITIGLGCVAVSVGARFVAVGRLSGAEGGAASARKGTSSVRLFPASGPLAAMIGKEIRYVLRDTLLLSQAGMPLILYLVPFVMAVNPAFRGATTGDELFAFAVLMVLTVLYMQASILSLSSVGLEGRAFWIVLASPGRVKTAIAAKWLASWLMASSMGVAMMAFSGLAFRADFATVTVLCGVVIVSAAGLCGSGVGLAAAIPRFTFENPAHRVSPMAIVLGFGLGIIYVGFTWATLALTWYAGIRWPAVASQIRAVGTVLTLAATLAAVAGPLAVGHRRLAGLDWEY
jgi:hypothetical protein